MPVYEYRCRACGEAFERLTHRQAEVACPACRSTDVARLLSLFGVKSGTSSAGSIGRGGCGCGAGGCGCH